MRFSKHHDDRREDDDGKMVVVLKGKVSGWIKTGKHIVVKTRPDGSPAQVECYYNTTSKQKADGPVCRYCGRILDYTTFVDRDTYDQHQAVVQKLLEKHRERRKRERDQEHHKRKVEVGSGARRKEPKPPPEGRSERRHDRDQAGSGEPTD